MLPSDALLVLCDFETTGVDPDNDYPIEVAILCCDSQLRVVGAFESLIHLPAWHDSYWAAVPIHGITPPMLHARSRQHEDVWREILWCVERCKKILGTKRTPTLLSDNAQFEFRFMLRLMNLAQRTDFPFHYCAWDASLLLEATGVGDPKPRHRAMADVGLLHGALLEALRRLPP